MGKGIAKRQRQKRVANANESNLHKATFGKALPTMRLPDGPADLKERVPASLRKLMKLKDVANKEEARRLARHEAQASRQGLQQPSQPHGTNQNHAQGHIQQAQQHQHQQQQQQKHHRQHQGRQPPAQQHQQPQPQQLGKEHAAQQGQQGAGTAASSDPASVHQATGLASGAPQDKKKPLKSSASVQIEQRIYKAGAFDQAKKKTLKESKQKFLERKKLQKKRGRHGGNDKEDSGLTPAELKLQAQQAMTSAAFGEVAAAPLKVQLKRKHWIRGGGEDQQADLPSASAPSHRLTKIFQAQLATAEQRLGQDSKSSGGQGRQQGLGQHAAGRAAKRQKVSAAGKGAAPAGLYHQAAAAKLAAEREKLRAGVVQAYKDSKRAAAAAAKGPGPQQNHKGQASMASLSKLVQRSSAQLTAAAQLR